jgi:hypothetical protein
MAVSRHLEQRLIEAGYSRSRLEKGNYALREAGRLPIAGRGPYAPSISAQDAAVIVLAYAASGSSGKAYDRLLKLEGLRAIKGGPTLLATIRSFIEAPTPFSEMLISRIRRRARILYPDGTEIVFAPSSTKYVDDRAENWWSIKAPLLHVITMLLRGERVEASEPDEPEDVE